MISKINNLINFINDKDSPFHERLVAIARKLSEPFYSIDLDLTELRSMVKPELADKDINIPEVKIDLW